MKRKVTTVKNLARWIDAEILPDDEESICLILDRQWTPDLSRGLKPRTIDELVTLHGRLSRAIPDDIDFIIEFEEGEVYAGIEFLDGPNAGFHMGLPMALDRNFIQSLRETDWDEFRAGMIQGTQFQENLTDFAADLPVTLKSVSEIQAEHAYAVQKFSKDMSVRNPKYGLLVFNENTYDPEYEVRGYGERDPMIGDIGDMMACEYIIIAIWSDGRLIDPNAFDSIRNEVLDGLGPISRAKAEGRFQAAIQATNPPKF